MLLGTWVLAMEVQSTYNPKSQNLDFILAGVNNLTVRYEYLGTH